MTTTAATNTRVAMARSIFTGALPVGIVPGEGAKRRLLELLPAIDVRDALIMEVNERSADDVIDVCHNLLVFTIREGQPDATMLSLLSVLAFAYWQKEDWNAMKSVLRRSAKIDPTYNLTALLVEVHKYRVSADWREFL